MSDPLESPRYMLARAQHHLAELRLHVEGFIKSDPYAEVVEVDPDSGEEVYKQRLVKPLPVALQGIASDAVCNLRSALDQTGYIVSTAAGGKGKDTHFPFGDTAAEAHSCKGAGSKEVPDEIFSVMESFKPYSGGDDFLWAINKLCNANKHRIVSALPMMVGGRTLHELRVSGMGRIDFSKHGGITYSVFGGDDSIHDVEILRTTPGAKFNYQVTIGVFVSFTEPSILFGQPAEGVLDRMVGIVDSVLMAVEAEARRVGLFT